MWDAMWQICHHCDHTYEVECYLADAVATPPDMMVPPAVLASRKLSMPATDSTSSSVFRSESKVTTAQSSSWQRDGPISHRRIRRVPVEFIELPFKQRTFQTWRPRLAVRYTLYLTCPSCGRSYQKQSDLPRGVMVPHLLPLYNRHLEEQARLWLLAHGPATPTHVPPPQPVLNDRRVASLLPAIEWSAPCRSHAKPVDRAAEASPGEGNQERAGRRMSKAAEEFLVCPLSTSGPMPRQGPRAVPPAQDTPPQMPPPSPVSNDRRVANVLPSAEGPSRSHDGPVERRVVASPSEGIRERAGLRMSKAAEEFTVCPSETSVSMPRQAPRTLPPAQNTQSWRPRVISPPPKRSRFSSRIYSSCLQTNACTSRP